LTYEKRQAAREKRNRNKGPRQAIIKAESDRQIYVGNLSLQEKSSPNILAPKSAFDEMIERLDYNKRMHYRNTHVQIIRPYPNIDCNSDSDSK
jgi:glycyl-tRNA synthetase beta subunit